MTDPIQLFVSILQDSFNDSKWNGAVLGKIKTISNTKVGSVGQCFIENLCEDLSIHYSFPKGVRGERLTQVPWDIEIINVKFELKTATEDTNRKFQFNHIRYHRRYEALLCLGVSPNNLYFGVWSKGDVVTGKAGNLVTMEKGANASFKLTKAPTQLYEIADFQPVIEEFTSNFNK